MQRHLPGVDQETGAFPGPDVLGRGVVLPPGRAVPDGFADAPVLVVDARVVQSPGPVVKELHAAWATRRRVVVRLAVDPSALKEPEACLRPPHDLLPGFEFERERLHYLVWANNYDFTTDRPRWRLADHAVRRLGAIQGSDSDLILPDGRPAWCDGGPREPLPLRVVHGESLALGRLRIQEPVADEGPRRPDDLAEDQARAVLHRRGPARIIAPAGSGKTRVLAARLRHLLRDRGYDPECVTAVAYNKRAAVELEQRTTGLGARVRTLHALGYEIVRRHREARVVQEPEVRRILASMVKVEPQRGKDPLATWVEALAEVRLALRPPAEVEKERGDVPGFARIFPQFRDALRERGAIDHDEQIYGALEILLAHPEERRFMQRQCRHLLVDEFQDLTPAYLMLVRLLAAPAYQVFGVGDDDQVIYGYLGATPEYLLHYSRFFPEATEYALECNYRCPTRVVESASHLLSWNRVRVPKNIRARAEQASTPDGGLHVRQVADTALARDAVLAVQQLIEGGRDPGQIAILSRVNSILLPIQIALAEARIPHTTPVDAQILERNGVRAALAWLSVASTNGTLPSGMVQETIHRPSRKIRRASSDGLARQSAWSERDLLTWARSLPPWERAAVEEYVADVRRLRHIAARATTAEVLKAVRVDIGLETEASTLDSSRSDARGQSHVDDLLALELLAPLHDRPASFEEWMRERLVPRGQGGVHLSTVHRVKGLEWDHVIVFDATWGLMPHHMADGPRALEEERRVFHVALTRGRQGVLVLANQATPSPYLHEMTATRESQPSQAQRKGKPVPSSPERKRGGRTSSADDVIVAEIGLALDSPHAGVISRLEAGRAWLELPSGRRLSLAYGTRIKSGGRSGRLGGAARVSDVPPAQDGS